MVPSVVTRQTSPPSMQVHRTLLYNHAALLLLPGMFRRRPLLFGAHWNSCREATDPGRTRDLVVCRPDFAHHWRADAQWWQQLVYCILKLLLSRAGKDQSAWLPAQLLQTPNPSQGNTVLFRSSDWIFQSKPYLADQKWPTVSWESSRTFLHVQTSKLMTSPLRSS